MSIHSILWERQKKFLLRLSIALIIVLNFLPVFSQVKTVMKAGLPAIHLRHVVLPGETFRTIGKLYGLTGNEVANYNNLEFDGEEVLAKYLTIPLNHQNFSSQIMTGTNKIVVPVFRVNGSREGTVQFSNSKGRSTSGFSVVYSNSGLTSNIRNNLQLVGYLYTGRENASVFKTARTNVAREIVVDADTIKKEIAAVTPPIVAKEQIIPVVDSLSIAKPVPVVNVPGLLKATTTSKEIKVAPTKGVPRAVSRLEKVLLLVKIQLSITVVLVICIFLAMILRNRAEVYKTKLNGTLRKVLIDEILAEDSFSDNIKRTVTVSPYLKEKITKKANRQFIIDEIVNGRKNIKGKVGDKFLELYLSLNLEQDSCNKLKSSNWNDVAKGIQELTIMDQQHKMAEIFNEINSKNEYVRMEAQCALVHLSGFGGLWFLNVLNYPISEWQQMKLIRMLGASPATDFPDLHMLLTSPNNSLVIFTLKLVGEFQQRAMHSAVVKCLQHRSEAIRFTAIQCLKDISNPNTADILVRRFASETRKNKLAILKVIGEVGDRDHSHFLLHHLTSNDDTFKISAARALNQLGKQGTDFLEEFCQVNGDRYTDILLHIKSEKSYDMV